MKKYIVSFKMSRYKFFLKLFLTLQLTVGIGSQLYAQQSTEKNVESQGLKVTGIVRDVQTKKGISAAQISLVGERVSATTDAEGKFTITVKSLTDVITVSAYDYNTTEVPLRGTGVVNIDLFPDFFSNYFKPTNNISGGAIENSLLVQSAKTVSDFSKTNAVSIDELIQGQFGGDVHAVTRSGLLGMGSTLTIRGINSLNSNAQPLFVVDGIIWTNLNEISSINEGFYSNPLDYIDVNDIESVSVIKDGTSIYGSKGSNGVVLINTKHSKEMVTKIALNVFKGFVSSPASYPVMSGEDFRLYASDMIQSKGGLIGNDISNYGFFEANKANAQVYNANHNNTDWQKEVYQTGKINSYSINATGGDDKAMYYFSLGYADNDGIVKSTTMSRLNTRFNADVKMFKRLHMSMNIGFTNVSRKLVDDGVSEYTSPTYISQIKAPFLSPYSFTTEGNKTLNYAFTDQLEVGNPLGVIKFSQNKVKKFRFNIGFAPKFFITPDLVLSSQFDYNMDKTVEDRFVPMYFTKKRFIENRGYSSNEVNSQEIRNINIYDDTRLSYTKSINKLHNLNAILGVRYIHNFLESDYLEEHNTGGNNITTISGSYDYLQVSGINDYTKSITNYLNLNYDYRKKYILSAVVSMDGSSRFGNAIKSSVQMMGHSWGIFPSANLGWVLSSEKFMKPLTLINFCKLRVGYGLTGNDDIQDYSSAAYFMSVRYYGNRNGLVLSNLENDKLQWEVTGKANAGLDLSVLNNRLSMTVDYFRNKTTNLLLLRDLPEVSGLGKYWSNGGALENNGFEVSLNLKAINLSKFKWEVGLTAGKYVNKITSLPGKDFTTTVYGGEVINAVGAAAGSFYGYKTLGVFATEAEASAANLTMVNSSGASVKFQAGDIHFADISGANGKPDGVINEYDKQIIGNPNPKLYGTISNKFSYGHFTLNTIFTYSYGNDVYNYKRQLLESGSGLSNQTTAMLRRWTAEGQHTDIPKAVYGDPMGNSRFSDRWIEDGSYLRLKTVSLSYDLGLKSSFIEGVNIWASVNNVFTLTKYLGADPEFSSGTSVYSQGVDAGLIPQTKSYYVGVKFNL